MGLLDLVTHDTGKNFISKKFKHYASIMGINTKGVPVKAHNFIGMIEQYHRLIWHAYQIITIKIPNINKDIALQIMFKAINNTTGPDGLVPILLVFSIYLWMVKLDAPLLSVI